MKAMTRGSLLSSLHSLQKYNIYIIFEIWAEKEVKTKLSIFNLITDDNQVEKKFSNLVILLNQVENKHRVNIGYADLRQQMHQRITRY